MRGGCSTACKGIQRQPNLEKLRSVLVVGGTQQPLHSNGLNAAAHAAQHLTICGLTLQVSHCTTRPELSNSPTGCSDGMGGWGGTYVLLRGLMHDKRCAHQQPLCAIIMSAYLDRLRSNQNPCLATWNLSAWQLSTMSA
jgi:hypothetical protein